MPKYSDNRNRQPHNAAASSIPAYTEPEVRRWPHPVCGTVPASETDSCLHYMHCALVYQNQLLAEIKTLLEHLCIDGNSSAVSSPQSPVEK